MRTKITLACTECKQRNYDTMKNKKNDPDRMTLKKYCRFCKKQTEHRETPLSGLTIGDKVEKMAKTNEKTKAVAEKSGAKKRKKFNPMNFFRRVGRYFREVISELKKVSWPSRKDLTNYSVAVLVFVAIFCVITFAMDTGLSALINLFLR